jgi:hypothetical protein
VGQNVGIGQELVEVVPLDDVWVTANLKETQLAQHAATATGRNQRGLDGIRSFWPVSGLYHSSCQESVTWDLRPDCGSIASIRLAKSGGNRFR